MAVRFQMPLIDAQPLLRQRGDSCELCLLRNLDIACHSRPKKNGSAARCRSIMSCELLLARRPRMAVLGMQQRSAARTDADQLQNHLFVLSAVIVMAAGGMLHEAAGFQAYGRIGIERVAGAGVPGALQHDRIAIIGMKM